MDMMSIQADDMLSKMSSPFSEFCFCHTSIISQSYSLALLHKKKKKSAHSAEIC